MARYSGSNNQCLGHLPQPHLGNLREVLHLPQRRLEQCDSPPHPFQSRRVAASKAFNQSRARKRQQRIRRTPGEAKPIFARFLQHCCTSASVPLISGPPM
ncbi:hypothetical protein ACODUL_09445 [Stenotrophomonas maltophilia]